MKYVIDGDGNISTVSEAVRTDMDEVPEPPEDARVKGGTVRYRWDRATDEFVQVEVDNRTTQQKVLDKLSEWEGGITSGMNKLDSLLSKHPTAQIALQKGNIDLLRDRLDQMRGTSLTPDQVDELIAIVE